MCSLHWGLWGSEGIVLWFVEASCLLDKGEYPRVSRPLSHCSAFCEYLPSARHWDLGGLGLACAQGRAEVPEPLSYSQKPLPNVGLGWLAL